MMFDASKVGKPEFARNVSGDCYGWYEEDIEEGDQENEFSYSSQSYTLTATKTEELYGLKHPSSGAFDDVDRDVTPRELNEALSEIKREALGGRHRTFLVWTEEADQASSQSLIKRIHELHLPNFQVKSVNSQNFVYELTQCYPPETVVVLPGGQGRHYERLFKDFKEVRRLFYDTGGSEFAVCAGAFFGTKISSYDLSSGENIYKERDQYFLDGLAKGPLFQPHKEISVVAPYFASHLGSQRTSTSLEHRLIRWRLPVREDTLHGIEAQYYVGDGHNVGGGYFVPSDELIQGVDFEPVLLYKADTAGDEDKIAALRVSPTKKNQGNWVGTMVHPEFYSHELADLFSSSVTLQETFPNTKRDLRRVASYDPDYKIAKSASDVLLLSLLEAVTTPSPKKPIIGPLNREGTNN